MDRIFFLSFGESEKGLCIVWHSLLSKKTTTKQTKTGISEMLHKRQALLVAIEGIYSHYHHGNGVINQAALCSSLFINWHLPLPHTVPLGICTTMVNALKDKL